MRSDAEQQNRSLRSQISLLEEELQQKSQRLTKVQKEAQTAQAQYQDLLARVLELQTTNSSLSLSTTRTEEQFRKRITDQDTLIASLQSQISEKEEQIESLKVANEHHNV
jgi:chromosome segregation ATPase